MNQVSLWSNVSREIGSLLRFVYKFSGWHAGAVSFPLSDVILAQLASPLSDVMLCIQE
jgi:hypothetical protein